MKRLLLLGCTLCLLLPASASAFIADFSGTAGGTGTVTFDAKLVVKRGKCIRRNQSGRCVRRKRRTVAKQIEPGMKFSQLPITCNEGDFLITLTKSLAIPIVLGKFTHNSVGNSGGNITITGQFSRGARSATGTVRDQGNIGPYTGCDTGTHTWSATR